MLNPPLSHRLTCLGPTLLRRWEQAGLPVAEFISGNDLAACAHFVDQPGPCRGRRLLDPPWAELKIDLAWLREHHQRFDEIPLILRRARGRLRVAWVVDPEPDSLEAEALRLAGAVWGRLSFEEEGGRRRLVGFEPGPPLPPDPKLLEALARRLLSGAPAPPLSEPELKLVELPRFGLAGREPDRELNILAQTLQARGAECIPLELPLFPDRRCISEHAEGVKIGGHSLEALQGIFLRSTGVKSPLPEQPSSEEWARLYPAYRRFPRDQEECFFFKYGVLERLSCPVINPPLVQEIHRLKLDQLLKLTQAGLPVPPTIASSDLERSQAFVEEMGGPEYVVFKPLAGIFKTRLLSEIDLEAALKRGPVMLQRYLRGETIRAYFSKRGCLGAGRILHEGSVDSSEDQRGVEPVKLPQAVQEIAQKSMSCLGLSWTGMDFIQEETGSFWILECNASAMFRAFSELTGWDVPEGLAELLLGSDEKRFRASSDKPSPA